MIGAVILVVVGTAVVGTGVALYSTLVAERSARAQVERTSEILDRLKAILLAAVDAETGQRGYLLTSDLEYLGPFRSGAERLPGTIGALDTILRPIALPDQIDKLDALDDLARRKLAELRRSIKLVESDRDAEARAQLASGEGKSLMDALRATIAELERDEDRILKAAIRQAADIEHRTVTTVAALSLAVMLLLAYGLWIFGRAARAEEEARNVAELRVARERADMLARELNHRVKNLFAVVSSIVSMTARGETEPRVAAQKARARIQALAAAHSVGQGETGEARADLRSLVEALLAPYDVEAGRLTLAGPAVALAPSTVTPVGLILHELATNAVKYGAWASEAGTLRVGWSVAPATGGTDAVALVWTEEVPGAPGVAAAAGFGTRMMTQAALQLGGTIETERRSTGIEVRLTFPN